MKTRFEIIERDGETTISVYMLSSKVSELFELHGRKMPNVMSRIVNKCHAVLIHLSSDRVRVFVSDENQIGNKFDILYPMHSDIDTDVYEKVGTDLDIDLNLNGGYIFSDRLTAFAKVNNNLMIKSLK